MSNDHQGSTLNRPLSVTVIALLYLAVGTVGFIAHFPFGAFHREDIWIELVEVAAVVAGMFLLRGQEWARWLTLAWMALHVILSVQEYPKLAVHCLFFAVIAWCLLRREATRYFRGPRTGVARPAGN
jgi:hypothetical protein